MILENKHTQTTKNKQRKPTTTVKQKYYNGRSFKKERKMQLWVFLSSQNMET